MTVRKIPAWMLLFLLPLLLVLVLGISVLVGAALVLRAVGRALGLWRSPAPVPLYEPRDESSREIRDVPSQVVSTTDAGFDRDSRGH